MATLVHLTYIDGSAVIHVYVFPVLASDFCKLDTVSISTCHIF